MYLCSCRAVHVALRLRSFLHPLFSGGKVLLLVLVVCALSRMMANFD